MATYNQNNPPGSEKIRNSDELLRNNFTALETMLHDGAGIDIVTGGSQTGKFTTPLFKDNAATPSTPTDTNEVVLFNNAGSLKWLRDDGTKREIGPIPSGTKMLFFQSSVPTGWTQDTSVNDAVIRMVDSSGGGTAGSDGLSGLSAKGHALTVAELPSTNFSGTAASAGGHTHGVARLQESGDYGFEVTLNNINSDGHYFQTTFGGGNQQVIETNGAHTHSVSVSSGGSGSSHSHNLDPLYADIIVGTKD